MKVTKRELLRRIEALEEWRDYADEMLTELNHALPDPEHDAKCAENAVAVEESLERHAVRLGLKKPKLKQLDQSVFDGLDEKWRFAAVDADGSANGFDIRVYPRGGDEHGLFAYESDYANSDDNSVHIGTGYDATNWQNSLIERDKVELTGSELCRAMLARGDKYVMCKTSGTGEAEAMEAKYPDVIQKYDWEFFYTPYKKRYAVPINSQGEPLTAADVGL